MKLWIARNRFGELQLFRAKPYLTPYKSWVCDDGWALWFNRDERAFPEVTFENSPMEVELNLIEK